MGKGGYNGGSTVINAWSGWFTDAGRRKQKRSSIKSKGLVTLTPEQKEAQLQYKIKLAAESLERAQAEFDAGVLKPAKPKPAPVKLGKKKRKKLKLAAKRARKRAAK